MISPNDINLLLADTYYTAAKTPGSEMRKVTEILETLRPHFTDQPVFDIWKHIRLEAGEMENEDLIKILMQLKYDYFNLIVKSGVQFIQNAAAKDTEVGFQAWLQIYAEAIIHWESQVYDRIDDVEFNFRDTQKAYLKSAQTFHDYIRDNRWADCFERYKSLAENPQLLPLQQALLHAIAAQIQLYHILDMECARKHLDTAKSLAQSPNAKIERCFGEWHLKNQEFDAARMFFMNAMSIDVNDADNYLAMGDSYRDERKWGLAEEYYLKAITINPLETSPYDRLIYIYGEPEMIKEKEPELSRLLHKIELLNFNSPDKRYSNWRYNGYRAMGWVYYRNENYVESVTWYNKAIKLQPAWSSAYIDLGNTWYASGDKKAAKKQYDKAENVAPDSYDVYWVLAWFYEQEASFETAITYYSKCIDLRPNTAKNTSFVIADIYSNQLKDFVKALACLEKLLETQSKDAAVYEKMATIYAKSGDTSASESAYEKALEISPNNHNSWNEIGVIRYRMGDYRKAATYFEKALSLSANDPVYHGNLSDALLYAGELEKSGETLQKALSFYPKNAELLNKTGNYYFDRKEYEEAKKYYLQAVENQPDNAVMNANLGGAYKLCDDLENAVKYYENALQLAPGNDYYLNELGIIEFRNGSFEKSADFFGQAATVSPGNATYFDNLGQALLQLPGKEKETEAAFLYALQLSPENDIYHNRTGNFYLLQGRNQEAFTCYQKAVSLKPDNAIYIANAGYAQYFLGQYPEAQLTLEKSVVLEPNFPQTHTWLALVYAALGDIKKGADYLLEKMTHTDDPLYLTTFLEIYGKMHEPELAYAQAAMEVIQRQPKIFEKYQELLSDER